jgi:hypothetical protein
MIENSIEKSGRAETTPVSIIFRHHSRPDRSVQDFARILILIIEKRYHDRNEIMRQISSQFCCHLTILLSYHETSSTAHCALRRRLLEVDHGDSPHGCRVTVCPGRGAKKARGLTPRAVVFTKPILWFTAGAPAGWMPFRFADNCAQGGRGRLAYEIQTSSGRRFKGRD